MDELPVHTIEKGRFKGNIIDGRTRRSIEVLEETKDYFLIDYFFHNGRFNKAKIPKQSVAKVLGQRFSFGGINPFVNHAQVRLILKEGYSIELYDRKTDEVVDQINDFVYTIEVAGPKGEAWSLTSAFGAFISAHRFISTSEVVFERVVLGNYVVEQSSPLLINDSQMNQVLEIFVRRSNKARMNEHYYLLNLFMGANNCTSELFRLLDKVVKTEYSFYQKLLAKLFWRLPIALKFYLKARGLINSKDKSQTLNEEFLELSSSEFFTSRAVMIKSSGASYHT